MFIYVKTVIGIRCNGYGNNFQKISAQPRMIMHHCHTNPVCRYCRVRVNEWGFAEIIQKLLVFTKDVLIAFAIVLKNTP